jgi:hypothetical protein
MFGDNWKDSNWLEIVAIPLATAIMRVAWVYPLLAILTSTGFSGSVGVRVPAWLLVALSFGATLLAHLAGDTVEGMAVVVLTGLMACISVVMSVFPPTEGLGNWFSDLIQQSLYWEQSLPPAPVIFVVMGLLWWRGMATRDMDHAKLTISFASGAFMMVVLLALTRILPPLLAPSLLTTAMLVYVVSGLATLALAGASHALSRNAYGGALQLSRHWFVAVVVVIGGVLLLGWVLGRIIAPDSITSLLDLLGPIWRLLGQVVYYLFYPIIYLLFLLLQPLFDWFQSLFDEQGRTPTPTPPVQETLEPLQEVAREISPALDYSLRGVVAVAVVLFLVFLFLRVLRKRNPKKKLGIVETRERILTWGLLREQIGNLLANARRIVPPPLFAPLAGAFDDPRRVIREAYRRFLSLAIKRGRPRAESETPFSYRQRLLDLAPGHEKAVETLTDAYVAARYDHDPPTAEQAAAAKAAMDEIEGAAPVPETSSA